MPDLLRDSITARQLLIAVAMLYNNNNNKEKMQRHIKLN
jgi:hypothetical protein